MLKFKVLIVCVFISFVAFGQDSISKIKPQLLKSIVEKGYTESMSLLNRTLPITLPNEFDFFYNYSVLEIEDERGYSVPTFSLHNLNTNKIDLTKVRGVRYDFVYKYSNNIGLFFTISYDLQKGAFFFEDETETNLKIINRLKLGDCKQCISNLYQYIKRNRIKDYQVQVKSLGKSDKLEKNFVWVLAIRIEGEDINKDSPFLNGKKVVLIDPATGKKADMSILFSPPTISE